MGGVLQTPVLMISAVGRFAPFDMKAYTNRWINRSGIEVGLGKRRKSRLGSGLTGEIRKGLEGVLGGKQDQTQPEDCTARKKQPFQSHYKKALITCCSQMQ